MKTDVEDEQMAIADQIAVIREEIEKPNADNQAIIEALQKLLESTKCHFQHEEDVMIINGYPGTLLHKRDHDYLLKGLSDFTSSLVDRTIELSPGIGDGLQSWLKYHMKRYDDAYLKFKARETGLG